MAAQPGPAALLPLAGTSWELVRFRSMDDAQGTIEIDDPTLYSVGFGTDGRATLRLNCNRAQGPWQATTASDGISGTLRFGLMAGTRALCPPPSLDERLLGDLEFVRGYLLHDGMLHMSLMADAGIYSWRPARTR
ncbi:MAG: META domain-containing protein [Burkholderiales bacterium]|nr:MAG: META domain-containing protein [Burkholderiales bacterium]